MHYVEDSNMFIHDQSYSPADYKQHLFFLDGTHNGWCATGGAVLKTEDGMVWQSKLLPSELQNESMYCVYFIDENIGWAVGSNGTIVKSTDDGHAWQQEAIGLTDKTLVSVFAIDENHVYVTGQKNTLLMYGEPLGVPEFDAGFEFTVYPNPSKDRLSLQSIVFSRQFSIVEIYDFNGKKLIEKQIPVETENFELNVSHLKSGVYFCKISTTKYSSTQKIIIQK
ncbi:MAG: T9SS type A sorting domain-containing protein [Bacteroidia bacterium]|nr:T9SS type A sorting domain-containing protein [Bacteroidia bacterium]